MINADTIISITETNQNLSKTAKMKGVHETAEKIADTKDVLAISERLIKQNKTAYEVLAK